MTQGIKTIDSIGTQLPTSSLEILLPSIVLSHLSYSALFTQHIEKPLLSSLEKQLNWSPKKVFKRYFYKQTGPLCRQKTITDKNYKEILLILISIIFLTTNLV